MGWKYLTLHEQRVISNISRPKGHAFQIPHHILRKGPNGGFSLSRFARIPRTKSPPRSTERSLFPLPPFLPFLFPSLSLFSPFSKKSPIARRTASETERGGGGGRKKQYAVGRSRGGVQTPASPISRLVVKHRALGRFRGAARLCRCFRPRRGFYTARIYTEQDEKADHLSSIEIRGQPTRGKRDRIVKLRVLALAALRSSSTMLARCTQDRASPEGDR